MRRLRNFLQRIFFFSFPVGFAMASELKRPRSSIIIAPDSDRDDEDENKNFIREVRQRVNENFTFTFAPKTPRSSDGDNLMYNWAETRDPDSELPANVQTEMERQFEFFLATYKDDLSQPWPMYVDEIRKLLLRQADSAATPLLFPVSFLHLADALPLLSVAVCDVSKQVLSVFHATATRFAEDIRRQNSAAITQMLPAQGICVSITHLPIIDTLDAKSLIGPNSLIRFKAKVVYATRPFATVRIWERMCAVCGEKSNHYDPSAAAVTTACFVCRKRGGSTLFNSVHTYPSEDRLLTQLHDCRVVTLECIESRSAGGARLPRRCVVFIGATVLPSEIGADQIIDVTGVTLATSIDAERTELNWDFPVCRTLFHANHVDFATEDDDDDVHAGTSSSSQTPAPTITQIQNALSHVPPKRVSTAEVCRRLAFIEPAMEGVARETWIMFGHSIRQVAKIDCGGDIVLEELCCAFQTSESFRELSESFQAAADILAKWTAAPDRDGYVAERIDALRTLTASCGDCIQSELLGKLHEAMRDKDVSDAAIGALISRAQTLLQSKLARVMHECSRL